MCEVLLSVLLFCLPVDTLVLRKRFMGTSRIDRSHTYVFSVIDILNLDAFAGFDFDFPGSRHSSRELNQSCTSGRGKVSGDFDGGIGSSSSAFTSRPALMKSNAASANFIFVILEVFDRRAQARWFVRVLVLRIKIRKADVVSIENGSECAS